MESQDQNDGYSPMIDLSVIIPVYRGSVILVERLPRLIKFLEAQEMSFEIIIVDDGSGDGSAEELQQFSNDCLKVIVLPKNRGKFGALKVGMETAQGNCRMFTDADIPYELEIIPHMYEIIVKNQFHLAVGDRNLPGSIYREQLGPIRSIASKIFTLAVRLLITSGLHDTQCGMKALRGDVADALFPLVQEEGFAGDVELLYIALVYNLSIRRVPARLDYQGNSSVDAFRDGCRMLRALLRLRTKRHRGTYESTVLRKISSQDYWNSSKDDSKA